MRRVEYLRIFSVLGAFLAGFWLPARLVGFIPPMGLEIVFDLLISAVSCGNLYLHFRDSGLGARRLKSWLALSPLLDLIAAMPIALVTFVAFGRTHEAFLLLNLLTVRHVRQIKTFLDNFDSLQPMTYRLVPLFITLPLLVHIVACAWIAMGSGSAGNEGAALDVYVRAVYWTFTTLTTVGYGDIIAKTNGQMLMSCGVQVVGVGVFGFILSNVAGLLARSDAARDHHMDNLDKIETFMNLHKTPRDLRTKIRTYYHYMWTNKKGYRDDSLIDDLPEKIQSELFMHINRPIIEKVPFLRGANPDFVSELMKKLKPRVFIPDEKIFRVDEAGDALYFIQSGSVDIVSRDGSVVATLHEGTVFGEMALISDKPRTATAVARSFCDVYSLEKEAFLKVMQAFPDFRDHLHEMMNERKSA